ncbi:hypothetical protein GSI_03599 [Ganoderma sinense ZZ0214-1]|uniref:Uncharacterized protein n=1 Tax=Ganoderma sinense ZZ0214-1 TaxID=1077348 RepID=A0A2G8SJE7_9APHY|nr:hypothetical protein GSI_03599 [Ganoderma sinense ZZ0214-1]
MSEDGSEDDLDDRFSPLPEGDNGDGDSDYVPDSDSEDKQKTDLRPITHEYSLRHTAQREADLLVSLVSEKSYNTRSNTRQAAKSG